MLSKSLWVHYRYQLAWWVSLKYFMPTKFCVITICKLGYITIIYQIFEIKIVRWYKQHIYVYENIFQENKHTMVYHTYGLNQVFTESLCSRFNVSVCIHFTCDVRLICVVINYIYSFFNVFVKHIFSNTILID